MCHVDVITCCVEVVVVVGVLFLVVVVVSQSLYPRIYTRYILALASALTTGLSGDWPCGALRTSRRSGGSSGEARRGGAAYVAGGTGRKLVSANGVRADSRGSSAPTCSAVPDSKPRSKPAARTAEGHNSTFVLRYTL